MRKIKWYLFRLVAMDLGEIFNRISRYFRKFLWKKLVNNKIDLVKIDNSDSWRISDLIGYGEEISCLLKEVDNIIEGNYKFLNKNFYEKEINWNFDNINHVYAPLDYAFEINYKDMNVVGDIKNIWEKNRHQHLTQMALAYALTRNENYAEAIKRSLELWVNQNPCLQGVNWASPLEMGIRLISWVWIERFLRGWHGYDKLFGLHGIMWESIYWQQKIISEFYSIGSSANNHLIGEMAGLYISSLVWPYFPESNEWQKMAKNILEREIEQQVYPSGLNKEQAFAYHLFVLEFFMLTAIEGERFNKPFSNAYKHRLYKMVEIIPSLMDVGGNTPNYGDSDDGIAVLLRPTSLSRIDWILNLAKVLFNLSDENIDCTKINSLYTQIVLPNENIRLINFPAKFDSECKAISDAGLYVLAANRNTTKEVFCLFDAGPIGYLSLAAHGHSDALSFTLNIGGIPVIVDPGTYQYNADLDMRNYFRGTKAHNTINIDDLDQSIPGGAFLWTKKANVHVLDWKETKNGALITARHDGYLRLPGKIIHERTCVLDNDLIEIKDKVLGSKKHKIEWRLHFSPQCSAQINNNQCIVTWNKGKMIIELDNKLKWILINGGENAGWYSEGFNLIQPTNTLIGSVNTSLPLEINCKIKVIINE